MNNNTISKSVRNEAESTPVTNCTCFIIPNGADRFKACYSRDDYEVQLKTLGISKPDDEEPMFQTWFFSDANDNHTCHGWGEELCARFGIGYDPKHPTYMEYDAPSRMPYSVLKDVKEGDVKEFTAPSGAKIRVKFEQLPWRYGRHGRFEEVVNNLYNDLQRWLAAHPDE